MPTSSTLQQRVRAAQQVWPDFKVSLKGFAGWVGAQEEPSNQLYLEDLYLAWAVAQGSPLAVKTFDDLYISRVGTFLALRPEDPFADEVRQAARVLLIVGPRRRIQEYSGKGSLDGWTRRVVVRLASRLRRQGKGAAGFPAQAHPPDRGQHPELEYLANRYRGEFSKALGEAMHELDRSSRRMLSLYFAKQLTVAQIAPMFRVSAPTISRRLAAIRAEVVAAMRTKLQARLALDSRELDSLLRLVRSRLDLSLERVLATSGVG